ncbi:hypothetical protein M404DRAFT_992597, partial [Pisolithus tinctorius Marx 270]
MSCCNFWGFFAINPFSVDEPKKLKALLVGRHFLNRSPLSARITGTMGNRYSIPILLMTLPGQVNKRGALALGCTPP